MDGINLVRIVFTVLSFACFLLIAFWAYGRSAKKRFDEAEMLPFADDDDSLQAGGTRSPPASDGAKK
jgi:cytochrome c oxidase cbb3-type subunit 4